MPHHPSLGGHYRQLFEPTCLVIAHSKEAINMLGFSTSPGTPFPCDRMSRRNFVRVAALGTLGLSLPEFWQQKTRAAGGGKSRGRSCIFVYLPGGPAQQETWDPKPDAPAEFRGEFKPIQTNVPGILVGEHLPMLAKIADKYCLVRSCHHDDVEHNSAAYAHLT